MDLDPALTPFLDGMREAFAPGAHLLPAAEFRARMERMAAAARPPHPPGMQVEDRREGAGGHTVPVRVYRPAAPGPLGTLVYLHGGGWVGGSVATHDASCAAIARDTPCNLVSVDYRLAPEHPYPAALEDCLAVARWLAGPDAPPWVDAARLAIGGDSAGANLSVATCLRLRDDTGHVPFVLQALLYPCVDVDTDRPSYRRNADAPFLDRAMMRRFLDDYLQGRPQAADGYAMPLRAATLAGLPPAFVMTAEHDPLLDDGVELAAKFARDGVAVDYRIARRLPHGFLRFRAVSALAQASYAELVASLARAFGAR
jgi:acetyl esterase